ncbi:MAG: phosphoribosylamine--glycine ligase [Nanoarchaeota archaeon]|nr:phosphoribosylamine--glycine ligase [Nanoarchaeota archaeon]
MEEAVMVIGGGAREHVLAHYLSKSSHVGKVFVAPGNAGTALEEGCENVSLKVNDFEGISTFVRENDISLTVVGPEGPLAGKGRKDEVGIVGYFHKEGLVGKGHMIFGPTTKAAQLEASKVYSKDFMSQHEIPTADFWTYHRPRDAINRAIKLLENDGRVVIKADGLAAGKGAIVCDSYESIEQAVNMISVLRQKKFGDAGKRMVVERFMPGEEASILAITDGKSVRYLVSSQDHKAVYDGDKGPNTGGMGAYAPAPVVTDDVMDKVKSRIIEPTIHGMADDEGTLFTGCLYAGLMIDKNGDPRVVEYNIRFGDPEAEPVFMMNQNDLFELLYACADGTLGNHEINNREGAACGVVMANGGYPGSYNKGAVIEGINEANKIDGVKVFHAGTAMQDGKILATGGRVLCVTAVGANIEDAIKTAYAGVDKIHWEGEYHRTDIGHRAIGRE